MNKIKLIDSKVNNNNKSNKKLKKTIQIFSFKSRQLWSDESDSEDSEYRPPNGMTQTLEPIPEHFEQNNNQVISVSTVDDMNCESNNGIIDDRTVAPIKISKKLNKKRMNWTIVGDDVDNGLQTKSFVDNEVKKVGKRGRKRKCDSVNGFTVTNISHQKNGNKVKSPKKSSQSEKKSCNKKVVKSYDRLENSFSDSISTTKGISSHYRFKQLLQRLTIDFHQILPQEMLIRIFNIVLEGDKSRMQSLINLSQVCESWRKLIISSPLLWQRLDLQTHCDEKGCDNDIQFLSDNHLFTNVTELNLNGWNGVNAEKVLKTIAESSAQVLREISIKNCRNISTNFLQTITTYCPNIEVLDISAITAAGHQNSQSPFTAPVFRPLLEFCGNKLLSLNLSENTMPSFPACITAIMELCPNLEILDISNIESFTKSTSIQVEKLQNSCPKLRVFRAANIPLTSCSAIQSNGFLSLEELSIPFSADSTTTAILMNAHTDAVIEQLTKSCESLKLLDIRGARYLTHRALVKIPAWNIQHLSISNCPKLHSEQLEMAFTKWNKSLIDVDLSWNITEVSVNACLKSLCDVDEESQLRAIQLRGSAVSYQSLKALLKSCKKLETIDLQSCRGLPRGIKRSYSGLEFVNLRNEIIDGKYD